MINRFVLFLGLLSLAAPPALQSQSTEGAGAVQLPQNESSGCNDAMLPPGETCPPPQAQQNPLVNPSQLSGAPLPANLGPAAPEGTAPSTILNETRSRELLEQLPPDQPTEYQKFVAETTGEFLPIYGEDLFRRVPSTFSPSDQVPVPPDYVIGPDDELRIRIWGQINFSGNLRVDRSGNIYLPQIGTVQVAGLQFSALDQHLRSAVAQFYRNFDLSVDIGRIRSIQVYISGQARRPGAYTISSLSSLVDALFATGGPSPEGSLRHILLRREGNTIADFDLYDLLIRGDKSKDVRLLPEDVLYVPPAGPEVAITGSVRSPGIFELRNGETIGDLLEMAGGATAVASNSRISLERVEQRQLRAAMEIDFNSAGLATVLADGDILRVYPILPAYDKTVTLRGFVANPGRFGWHPGMRLTDLIPDRDSLVSRDYWWRRSHLGLPASEFEPMIPETQESFSTILKQNGESSGGFSAPSQVQSNATIASALMQPTPSGAGSGAQVGQTTQPNQSAQPGPARQSAEAGATAREDRLRLPASQIDWDYAVIERVDPKSLVPSLIPFDLGKLVLDQDSSQDLALQPGDTVTVFSQSDIRVPLDQQVKYVDLEGEVVHSGFYSILPGETLRDVVRRAGGLTPRAYLYGSEFTRESARILQQQRLDEYVRELSLDAERGAQALAVSASNSGSALSDVAASRAATEEMIARLSQIKATGRIVLRFQPTSSTVDDVPALTLENGDKFVVPFAPANINVVGSVYDQNSYAYEKGKDLGYYLQLAGGTSRNADWRHAFLIRADGSVISRTHMAGSGFWKESFDGLKLHPGDTIVVPDKTIRPTALRGFLDWSQLFSQLALGAAAINVL
jgi:protein involved in polysaccharide export with SLBB domain